MTRQHAAKSTRRKPRVYQRVTLTGLGWLVATEEGVAGETAVVS